MVETISVLLNGLCLVAQSCPTLLDPTDLQPSRSSVRGILQARILEWVAMSLLQGIFPTQGLNPGLLHCRQIFYQLSHKGNPRILGWVAYPFSSGSSWPKDQTRVSCIAGQFFTNWALREAQNLKAGLIWDSSDQIKFLKLVPDL